MAHSPVFSIGSHAGQLFLNLFARKNSLLLPLDDPNQHPSTERVRRVLSETELERLADWEAYAVLSALDLKPIEKTPEGIARKLGADLAKVESLLTIFCSLGFVERVGHKLRQTGVSLTTGHRQGSAALRRAHREWIEKSLDALSGATGDTGRKRDGARNVTELSSRQIGRLTT